MLSPSPPLPPVDRSHELVAAQAKNEEHRARLTHQEAEIAELTTAVHKLKTMNGTLRTLLSDAQSEMTLRSNQITHLETQLKESRDREVASETDFRYVQHLPLPPLP